VLIKKHPTASQRRELGPSEKKNRTTKRRKPEMNHKEKPEARYLYLLFGGFLSCKKPFGLEKKTSEDNLKKRKRREL